MNKTIEKVIRHYGGIKGVQDRFDYGSPMAVYNWLSRGIPRALLGEIAHDTKIPFPTLLKAVSAGRPSSSRCSV